MDSRIHTADLDGTIDAGGGGYYGLRVKPSGDSPGRFPVTVRLDWSQNTFQLDAQEVYRRGRPFEHIKLEGLTQGSTWLVTKLAADEEIRPQDTSDADVQISVTKDILNAAPAVAGDSFFAVPASWIGGTIHVIANDVANNRSLRKWVLSSGVWRPAGTWTTDKANDVTQQLGIYTELDGFALEVTDGLGALTADITVNLSK